MKKFYCDLCEGEVVEDDFCKLVSLDNENVVSDEVDLCGTCLEKIQAYIESLKKKES